MATTSSAPTPNAAPAEPAPTAPSLGEVDKIILQDMLAERTKLRDAIPDSVKYAGVALVGLIVFMVNAKYQLPQSRSAEQTVFHDTAVGGMLVCACLLLLGFVLKLDEMNNRLQRLNEAINQKLKPWSVKVDDKSIIDHGRYIIRFTLVITVLTMYIGWQYSKISSVDNPKKPATVAPSKP